MCRWKERTLSGKRLHDDIQTPSRFFKSPSQILKESRWFFTIYIIKVGENASKKIKTLKVINILDLFFPYVGEKQYLYVIFLRKEKIV